MKFFIVTGMSGAGKSTVLHHFEDSGCQCMDNLPPSLLSQVFSLFDQVEMAPSLVVLGVDTRSGVLFDADAVLSSIESAREKHMISILFLDCDTEALIDRYKETRRDHPLQKGNMSLEEAIQKERNLLQPLREHADYILSSSGMRTRELCSKLDILLSGTSSPHRLRVEIMSFGFKRGIPRESDLVFDVRFLPNPYYIKEIRAYTGLETPVRDYVLSKDETKTFLTHLFSLIDYLLPLYQNEGKRRLLVAIGCTGGAHRSVAISQALYEHLLPGDYPVNITHRDIAIEEASWPFQRARDHAETPS
ncbi:MAG: RNase adapter RapZ [Clostridia bacterium]|nr:RNase adapter RapZ [Clostridia bacterium]